MFGCELQKVGSQSPEIPRVKPNGSVLTNWINRLFCSSVSWFAPNLPFSRSTVACAGISSTYSFNLAVPPSPNKGYSLQRKTTLSPSASWTTATDASRFYRLKK